MSVVMIIVKLLAAFGLYAGVILFFGYFSGGIIAGKEGDDVLAKHCYRVAGMWFVIFVLSAVCVCVFSSNFLNNLGDWRSQSYVGSGSSNSGGSSITHYDNCKCRECLEEKEGVKEDVHDADCQCSTCKPHDEDCQCSKCVEKYCNSFNHGDDCECDKCLYCKEYVK